MSRETLRELLYSESLADSSHMAIYAQKADAAHFAGRACLRVENGLLMLNEPSMTSVRSGRVEVDIAAEGPCFPGVAFRIADPENYEMVYSQPHSSGQWDALQYDPVFNGSNTWQIYHGEAFQKQAEVPMGKWYTFFVEFSGSRAKAGLLGQDPLLVEELATSRSTGGIGVWTYLPAHFANLRVYDLAFLDSVRITAEGPAAPTASASQGIITDWLAQGYGVVTCEPHGILNLNRYFALSQREVVLTRKFSLDGETTVAMSFGLSDDLTLSVDGLALYATTKAFRPTAGRQGRGYIELGTCRMTRKLSAGIHNLEIKLKVTEPFGWGLVFTLAGEGLRLLPASR